MFYNRAARCAEMWAFSGLRWKTHVLDGASEIAKKRKCGLLNQSHARAISCQCCADHRLHTRGGIEFEQSRTVSELLKKAKDKAAGTASAIKFSYELVEAAGGEHASSRAS